MLLEWWVRCAVWPPAVETTSNADSVLYWCSVPCWARRFRYKLIHFIWQVVLYPWWSVFWDVFTWIPIRYSSVCIQDCCPQRKVLWENKGHRAAQICLSGYVKFANRDKKSLNCNLWFVWKVDCRCISRMTIWSHQVVLPLLVSYMGSCSTCVQQSFSPTCDNCRSLWALALLSIHVIVIHNERNTLKASCFPAAALQPATSQLVKKTTSLLSWLLFSEPAHFEKYFLSCRAGLWDITCLYCRAFNLMSLRIESNPGRSLRMTRLLCSGALTQHSVDLPESFCQKALFKTVNFSCICIVCIAHFCDYLCKTAFQSGGETCHLALIWKVCVSNLSSGWIDPLWLTFTVQENKDELREIQVVCLCAPAPEK